METRCCNDNLPEIQSRICAKRLVSKIPSPCAPYSRSPSSPEKRVLRMCIRSLEITLVASFLGARGRHGHNIHEKLFEEISFGRPKSNQTKNMFFSTFDATPTLMSENNSLETLRW